MSLSWWVSIALLIPHPSPFQPRPTHPQASLSTVSTPHSSQPHPEHLPGITYAQLPARLLRQRTPPLPSLPRLLSRDLGSAPLTPPRAAPAPSGLVTQRPYFSDPRRPGAILSSPPHRAASPQYRILLSSLAQAFRDSSQAPGQTGSSQVQTHSRQMCTVVAFRPPAKVQTGF